MGDQADICVTVRYQLINKQTYRQYGAQRSREILLNLSCQGCFHPFIGPKAGDPAVTDQDGKGLGVPIRLDVRLAVVSLPEEIITKDRFPGFTEVGALRHFDPAIRRLGEADQEQISLVVNNNRNVCFPPIWQHFRTERLA